MSSKVIILDIAPSEEMLLDIEDDAPMLVLDTEGAGYTGGGGANVQTYEGDYNVIPSEEQQTLKTQNRYLKENVTVEPVPTYTVSNAGGGTTFVIG